MSAATVNMEINRGSSQDQSWIFKAGGVVVDISDWHAKLQIRPLPESDELIYDANDDPLTNLVIDGKAGKVTLVSPGIALASTDLSALPEGSIVVPDPTRVQPQTAKGRLAWFELQLIVPATVSAAEVIIPAIVAQVVFTPWVVAP